MHQAARVCVDKGMFVPARTLSVAAMRMDYEDHDGADVVQVQFLRSLNKLTKTSTICAIIGAGVDIRAAWRK